MHDVMVSIRLPRPLVSEIKKATEKEHYLDLSEAIRSIVRDNWLKYNHPEMYHLSRLREEIKQELKKKAEKSVKKEVISELKKIREMIKLEEIRE
jgi:Arc/MetJ-type ribon-helix-helix transcriptional regulator